MSRQYTGHKDTSLSGEDLIPWVKEAMSQDSAFYGVKIPTDKQIALVISAMKSHTLLVRAAQYDYSEIGKPDQVTDFYPIESSIGRYFRDAAVLVLDER